MSSIIDKNINDYIAEVCLLVKNKKVHNDIKEELENHILEITDMYIEQGLSDEESIKKALIRMGSSEIIGKNLNKVHRTAPDILLTILTCMLVFFGLFTLGYIELNNHASVNENIIQNSILFILIGLIFAILIYKADYRALKRYSKKLYISCVISSIILILLKNNSTTGITLKNLIIFGFVVSIVGLIDNFNFSSKKSILTNLFIAILTIILILKFTNSVALCLLYTISVTSIIICCDIKLKYKLTYFTGMSTLFIAYILIEPFRRYRLLNFFDYYTSNGSNDYNYGWIYQQLENIRNSATLLGNGNTYDSSMFLHPHSDNTLSYIIYSFGWIATIILLITILCFIIRIAFISKNSKNSYGKLLTVGICSFFLVQFAICILTTFGLIPYTSIGLPFISYSGSQLIISIISISLINNVYKWRNTNSSIKYAS